ncbi:MAG TPA: methyltransferase domain-containing protein, partial [Kofleriaceae bacterium]
IDAPGASWRSRMEGDLWQVNAGHEDYVVLDDVGAARSLPLARRDEAKALLDRAIAKLAAIAEAHHVVTSARFHHASAVALPFGPGQFTHALCLEAAHHFDTRERWLREAYRVLAPGGRLAMADFAIVRSPSGAWQRAVYDAVCAAWSVPRANAISPDGYVDLLRDIGFVDIELQQVGALTFPGYWQEQRRLERRREVLRIRGRLGAAVGVALNYGLVQLYEQGWVEYVLVSARKP